MTGDKTPKRRHSTLYHLEPIGIGTPLVESLTSYLARLASAHCLPVQPLLIEILAPELKISKIDHTFSRFFKECACSVNGLGQYAEDFQITLERLTLREDLSQLTMLPWKSVFDPGGKGLNKPHKTWCPSCFREWEENGGPLYEPLIWTLSSVHTCEKHRIGLRSSCSECGSIQPILARIMPIGCCSSCGSRLWSRDVVGCESEKQCISRNLWFVESIGELLSASPFESSIASHKSFQLAVSDVIRHLGISNTKDLDRAIGFGESTLTQWRRGRGKPRFDYFLLFCFKTGINPKNMLCHSSDEFLKYCRLPVDDGDSHNGKHSSERKPLRKEIVDEIDRVLSSDEPPSLREFSKRLGVGIGFLRYRFPNESKMIAARYKERLRKKKETLFQSRCEAIRKAVEELDAAQEYPSKGKVFGRIPEMSAGGRNLRLTNIWKETIGSKLGVKKQRYVPEPS
ncbi:MAG: TniQ family protein [Leptospirillum sp.]